MTNIPVQGICDARFTGVRELLQQSFERGEEIGAAACFTLDGKIVVDLWGGHYDFARTRAWERDTLVNVYSSTKGMTAICANLLVERGLLNLDAPVARYWPEFAAAGKKEVKIRWLLSHRAGLCGVREPLPHNALYDWQRMCDALAAEEPWWVPGEFHGYHAFTFGFLVGEVVRRITGQSLGAFFRQEVAGPLSADFHIGLSAEHDSRTADMHSLTIGNVPAASEVSPSVPAAFAPFAHAIKDPTSMQYAALFNPPQDQDAVNQREWRAAEIPSANGHGTARSLAQIYGALACAGQSESCILKPESIERAITEESAGPERLFLGAVPMRFGLGFVLNDQTHRYSRLSPNPRSFGHAGGGGSLGMADPDERIGFGFTMNRMHAGLVSAGATPTLLIDAFYAALRDG